MNWITTRLQTGFLIVCLCLCATSAWSQPFSKARLHERIQTDFKNKRKTDIEKAIQHPELWNTNRAANTENPKTDNVTFRDSDASISNTKETESEIHAAVNPKDTNNIIVGVMKFSEDILNALTFPIYYTKDFGRTWQISQFNGVNDQPGTFSLTAGGGDPVIVFDDKGVAYFSWLTLSIGLDFKIKAGLHWAISSDGGATWKRQNSLLDEGEMQDITGTSGRLPDKEWLASDLSNSPNRGNVYVAYAYINSLDTSYNIFVKTKKANGTTFENKVDLTPAELTFAQFTSIDVDAKGVVHVMFAAAGNEDAVASLYHCKSTNGGTSFSAPVKISPFFLSCFPPGVDTSCSITGIDKNRVYPCPHMRVDKSNGANSGNLYVVWTANGVDDLKTTGTDIYFSKSKDGGSTWTAARILNNDKLAEHDQFFPSLAVNSKGTLVITWYDRREDEGNEMTKYYMTTSKDGGDNFLNDFPVSTTASDFTVIGQSNGNFGVGEYTQVVTTDNYAIPFWADGRGNDGNIEVFTSLVPIGNALTTSVQEVSNLSDQFSVTALFPNPAKNSTTLDIELKESFKITIQLFSADGKLQKTYKNRTLASGEHRVQLDVKNMPSGQYWCVVRSDFGFKAKSLMVKN